jgi:hypothetical protein
LMGKVIKVILEWGKDNPLGVILPTG